MNADDTPVMPQGNMTGITRKFHADLRTWITEGAKLERLALGEAESTTAITLDVRSLSDEELEAIIGAYTR